MTREEAIEILKDGELNPCVTEDREACEMAIKALEQEPCYDAISRQAVIDALQPYIDANKDSEDLYLSGCGDGAYHELYTIKSLPPVNPTRPNAHNNNEDYAECDQFVCSNCGIELQDWHRVERDEDDGEVSYHEYTFKFCPNCGAEMESEE